MLELKIIETWKPNTEFFEIMKDYTYKIKKEKMKHIIVDVYTDAGHSGKDLMPPEMQRLLMTLNLKRLIT